MARAKLASLSFDLLILDVMMPGETGFELAKFIRQTSGVPILMLTARDAAESRITGLELGADDYVSKPFEPRELSLRVASILRRARPAAAPMAESIRFGQFVFHLGRTELRRGDEVVRLTDREREMLAVLAAAPGEPCRGWRSPAPAVRSTSAPWMSRSTACGAKSSSIRPTR